MKQFFSYVKGRVRADKILTAIVFVFIAFCVGSGIYFGVIGQARNCVMSFAYVLVVPVIYAWNTACASDSPLCSWRSSCF